MTFSALLAMRAYESIQKRVQLAPPGIVNISQLQAERLEYEHRKFAGLAASQQTRPSLAVAVPHRHCDRAPNEEKEWEKEKYTQTTVSISDARTGVLDAPPPRCNTLADTQALPGDQGAGDAGNDGKRTNHGRRCGGRLIVVREKETGNRAGPVSRPRQRARSGPALSLLILGVIDTTDINC